MTHRERAVVAARPAGARVLLSAGAAAALALAGGCTDASERSAAAKGADPPAAPSAEVPEATTHTTVHGAPRDLAATSPAGGLVVHPVTRQMVLDAPGGRPVATLPTTQLGSPTWVPVVSRSGAWVQVLLPSKPNGATGWMSTAQGGLRMARTSYLVKVDVSRRRLTLLRSGRTVGRWTVAVGARRTPTPAGRTFLLALLQPSSRTPSPLLIPLGTHSATLDSFGGGPGTVALHGWPDPSVFGKAVTHGCVRVPDAALRALSHVPLGTLVLITG
ncbi:L,D-transpeptidase [Actinomadura sp. NBRC 104412]|uniref:L,D-transpeptidase n=1 Tax=Actinomadura sp. NBRC 104412 TaxID=3032203 RepID=UPI0025542E47|nr:L,D-transpeptidase [Actinomadura sp. NBRC 104412]